MTNILTLVVLATCLVSTSFGAPQLFPFSNLRAYFDHQIKEGLGTDKDSGSSTIEDTSQEQSQVVEIPVLLQDGRKVENFPKNHRPALEETSYEPAEAAPVVDYHPSFPAQILRAPATGEPVNYATLLEAQNKQEQILPATVLLPPTTDEVPSTVQFLPPVPSQVLQTPPLPQGTQVPTSSQTPESYNILIEPSVIENFKPVKTNKNINQNNYPKKYRPEKDNHRYSSSADSGSDFTGKKKTHYPKKENSKQMKEQEQYKQHQKQQQNIAATVEAASFQKEVFSKVAPSTAIPKGSGDDEQVAAESGFSGISAGAGGHGLGAGGGDDRVEFQMHGQHGPHSYKWGYDTGKGHNRQFRYEERDTHGHVKGHYGFYDKSGKLQVVNYSADPHSGFHAEGDFGKHSIA